MTLVYAIISLFFTKNRNLLLKGLSMPVLSEVKAVAGKVTSALMNAAKFD